MAVNHLEQLIAEWLEFKGYFVRRNVRVGRRLKGGYEGELDIVAYNPQDNRLLHVEPSITPMSWEKREIKYKKKFDVGKKYIVRELFPWIPHNKEFEQWAVFLGQNVDRSTIGGGTVKPFYELLKEITADVKKVGSPTRRVIPEQFLLLRTIQFTVYVMENG